MPASGQGKAQPSPGDPGAPGASGPRRLALDAREMEELLSLCGGERMHSGPVRRARKAARVPMRGSRTCAKVHHPGGGVSFWEIGLIDISDGGLGFIYPGFLHVGTRLLVMLRKSGGGETAVPGRVIWCRFLRKQYHAVGLTWEQPIESREFVASSDWIESMSNSDTDTTTRLSGRLIHLCSNPVEHQLLKMQTSDTDLRVEWARDTGSLLDGVRTAPADVVVVDAEAMGASPADLLRTLRFEQHMGPILITASPACPGAEALRIDDDIHLLAKPLTQDALMASIRTGLHQNPNPLSGTGPIYSTLETTLEKRRWINEYLVSCRSMTKHLNAVIGTGDVARAAEICQSLAVTGAGYGFPLLSEVASGILESVGGAESLEEHAPKIRGLVFLINRLQVAQAA